MERKWENKKQEGKGQTDRLIIFRKITNPVEFIMLQSCSRNKAICTDEKENGKETSLQKNTYLLLIKFKSEFRLIMATKVFPE